MRLALDPAAAAGGLLVLRDELPRADASAIAARHPYLLGLAPDALRASAREVRARLGTGALRLRRASAAGASCRPRGPIPSPPHPHQPPPLAQFKRLLLEQGGSDPDALAQVGATGRRGTLK